MPSIAGVHTRPRGREDHKEAATRAPRWGPFLGGMGVDPREKGYMRNESLNSSSTNLQTVYWYSNLFAMCESRHGFVLLQRSEKQEGLCGGRERKPHGSR